MSTRHHIRETRKNGKNGKSKAKPRWCDERVSGHKREPMHAPLHAYESLEAALAHGCTATAPESKWVLRLTPALWHFHLAASPADAPTPHGETGFDTSEWGAIEVPLSWQLGELEGSAAVVHDRPIYTNYRYPFSGKAWSLARFPVPREANPVGSYQIAFEVPAAWDGRRVLLVLEGADSNATVWVDGIEVGYMQDSRLPSEFDVTAACASALSSTPLISPWSTPLINP